LWRRRLRRWPTAIAVAVIALGILNFYPRAALFLPGLVLFAFGDTVKAHRRLFRFPLLALIVFLFVWGETGVNDASPASQLAQWVADGRIVYFFIGIGAAMYLFAGVITGQGLFGRLLSCRVLKWIGTVSYSFYLWSSIVIVVVRHVMLPHLEPAVGTNRAAIAFVLISSVGSLVVAWLSWFFFETWVGTSAKKHVQDYMAARRQRRFNRTDVSAELSSAGRAR
jgi:peptidoglycan/LPS O-acetylase OafA/YrhL